MEKNRCFIYTWHIDEEQEDCTSIRIYCLGESNESICLKIENFTPFIYLELPTNIKWDEGKAQLVGNKLNDLMGEKQPLKKVLVFKKRLYGAHLQKDSTNYKSFPYLLCSFATRKDVKVLSFKLRKKINVVGLGSLQLKIHESDADEILQLTCCRKVPTAGWIEFHGKKIEESNKITLCDLEYKVSWKNIIPYETDKISRPKILGFDIEVNSTNPTAMPKASNPGDVIFQISCVLCRYGDTPDEYEKHLLSLGQPDLDVVGDDILVTMFDTEAALLEGFTEFIRQENPHLIAGYNILQFDIPYMIDRAREQFCMFEFDKLGFHKYNHAREKTIKWSSAAYKNQEFKYLDGEGRVFVDLLPLVQRDFKFNNYKLKTISEYFVGETKDPLSAKGIFKCYRIGIKKNSDGEYSNKSQKAMGVVGKYCVQDSALVCLLMDKLQTWVGLTEMAKTCNVPIFTLYTQGQQIKVYSQLYRHCMYKNIVVEKDAYEVDDNERYVGAHVFPPIPGQYKKVIPFDFASLYPTTIIAYNIDYHTWVPDGVDVPDEKCHIMEWEDHIGCEHDPKIIRVNTLTKYINIEEEKIKKIRTKRDNTADKFRKKELQEQVTKMVNDLKPYKKERSEINKTKPKNIMCDKRSYKFIKEPPGILPTIIQNLLDARKHTRKVDMIQKKDRIKELLKIQENTGEDMALQIKECESILGVLDKRQLAYKVSANSMYGAMGVRRGYLPFMPGAMCTTYMGRKNIELVAKTITEKHGGELIYGDTDSNYIYFPHKKDSSSVELWDYAEEVADKVTRLFPPPVKLEFEEAIYDFFFILTKKRYMYRAINSREGEVEQKIGKKGVLLARRDNSKFVRDIYEGVISQIADGVRRDEVIYWILKEINSMFAGNKPYSDFVITKSVGNCNNCQAEIFYNDKNEKKAKVGDYTTPVLSSEPTERLDQMKKKGASSAKEFYLLCLPAQVQLAERMRRRGQRVDAGSRLEYLVSDPTNHTGKQYDKIESSDYYKKHSGIIKIDYFYYLKALANPLDQVLNVAYGKDNDWKQDMILNLYNFKYKIEYKNILKLKELFRNKIEFEEE